MVEAHSLNEILNKINNDLSKNIEYIPNNQEQNEPTTISFMTTLEMDKPTTHQKIKIQGKRKSKLIGLLLAHPSAPIVKKEIVQHLNHFHHRSGEAIDFFCVGYGAYWPKQHYPDQIQAAKIDGVKWSYSDKAFSKVIDELMAETSWEYSGETELLLISARKDSSGNTSLDYRTAIVCNLESMSKDKAFTSVRAFFEQIFKFSKRNMNSYETWGLSDQQGIKVGKSAIKDALLSLLPKNIKESYKKAEHYAVRNIE